MAESGLRVLLSFLLCFLSVFGLATVGEARRVRVGLPDHTISQIPFYVAKEKGYYRAEGLEVELILMGGAVANLALIAGEIDFTTVPTAALSAAIRGAPLRIVFNTFNRPLHWLYSKPEIREVKELKGKKVAIGGIGSALDFLLREILSRRGLEAGRDVIILSVGVLPNRYAALLSGSVDAAMLTFPTTFAAGEAGLRELVSFVNENLVLPTGSIVATEKLLQSDTALAEKFIRASYKGFLYSRANRSETVSILERNIKAKEDVASRIYDLAAPAMSQDGTLGDELQKKYVDNILKIRGVKESPSFKKFFNFSLLQEIQAALKAKGWKPDP